MPPSASPDTVVTPSRAAWFDFAAARSLRKLIGRGAEVPSDQDWAWAPKAPSKSRRPVWE